MPSFAYYFDFVEYYNTISGSIYNDAYNDGYNAGEQIGYGQGYGVGYGDGRDYGYEEGIIIGNEQGYEIGFGDGEKVGYERKYVILDIIKKSLEIVASIFTIEIMPGVPIAAAFAIPLILAIVAFALRWFR